MRSAPMPESVRIADSSIPFLGGSVTIASGQMPLNAIIFAASDASAHMNSAFSIPFRCALRRAFSTASGTISAPMTFCAFFARYRLIVPAPQYISSTVPPSISAYSSAFSYSRSAWGGFI